MKYYESKEDFVLENGAVLEGITIAYDTFGTLNPEKDNVIWICHALTANSDPTDWWKGLVGEGCLISPERYFIVCANILGSCYGTTGPMSENPATGQFYFSSFPQITIRDMVKAHILLRQHLGIESIYLMMGGSMGGYQALEWALMEKEVVERLFLIATSPSESAWGVSIHTAQRLAIEADPTWKDAYVGAGSDGLKAARAIGILTYRNYRILGEMQTDPDPDKIDDFRASSYIIHQGNKLAARFNAYSYWLLTKALDSHHLARARGGDLMKTLSLVDQPTLIVNISSDILCPLEEQQFMADHMPHTELKIINSNYGHDGFIIETEQISLHLKRWLRLH